MKPEYKFEFKIVDTNNDEVVASGSTYISKIDPDGGCESIEMELFSALRAFNNKRKEEYEMSMYPTEEETV